MPREAEAVTINHVDIAGSDREAVFQHSGAFVGQSSCNACQDFIVLDRAPRDSALRSRFGCELIDQRVGNPLAAASLVLVPTRARFLAVATHRKQAIGHFGLWTFSACLADGRQILTNAGADVDAGDVLHAVRADGQTEVGQYTIDLLHARAFLEQEVRLSHVVRQHPVRDKAKAIPDHDRHLRESLAELHRRRDQ